MVPLVNLCNTVYNCEPICNKSTEMVLNTVYVCIGTLSFCLSSLLETLLIFPIPKRGDPFNSVNCCPIPLHFSFQKRLKLSSPTNCDHFMSAKDCQATTSRPSTGRRPTLLTGFTRQRRRNTPGVA